MTRPHSGLAASVRVRRTRFALKGLGFQPNRENRETKEALAAGQSTGIPTKLLGSQPPQTEYFRMEAQHSTLPFEWLPLLISNFNHTHPEK
jgi:hypothetical protein